MYFENFVEREAGGNVAYLINYNLSGVKIKVKYRLTYAVLLDVNASAVLARKMQEFQ
jgi:hypothetical protein